MSMTDPIADMLTRVRNANSASHESVAMPSSTMKAAVAQILKDEGYIGDFVVDTSGARPVLRIELKYAPNRERTIRGIRRISKPGLRVYAKREDIPRVLGGLGIAILSTSRGLLTDRQAVKQGVGGEVVAFVW